MRIISKFPFSFVKYCPDVKCFQGNNFMNPDIPKTCPYSNIVQKKKSYFY